jgi:hypothetical protein
VLVTICTIRQLPQAFTLGDSFVRYSADASIQSAPVLIGLLDDLERLPADFVSPYPLLSVRDWLPADQLARLSATYTPTEFAAACKPRFIREVFRLYPAIDQVLYADPNLQFFDQLTPVWESLATANALLTPHITRSPADQYWPDEKFFQNVGLYSADFLALRRSDETNRLLAWWQERVQERAYIDFCAGLCTDQLWLMHVPIFFPNVVVVRQSGWHVALWNLHERTIRQDDKGWLVTGPAGQTQRLLFANFKGLLNIDEGFFPHQNRLRLSERPYIVALLNQYRRALATHKNSLLWSTQPACGQQPEPVVVRGWRRVAVKSLNAITRFIDEMPLPRLH